MIKKIVIYILNFCNFNNFENTDEEEYKKYKKELYINNIVHENKKKELELEQEINKNHNIIDMESNEDTSWYIIN